MKHISDGTAYITFDMGISVENHFGGAMILIFPLGFRTHILTSRLQSTKAKPSRRKMRNMAEIGLATQ